MDAPNSPRGQAVSPAAPAEVGSFARSASSTGGQPVRTNSLRMISPGRYSSLVPDLTADNDLDSLMMPSGPSPRPGQQTFLTDGIAATTAQPARPSTPPPLSAEPEPEPEQQHAIAGAAASASLLDQTGVVEASGVYTGWMFKKGEVIVPPYLCHAGSLRKPPALKLTPSSRLHSVLACSSDGKRVEKAILLPQHSNGIGVHVLSHVACWRSDIANKGI